MAKLYAEISKTEEQDDGTIKVWGYASSEAKDSDGETVTADAMKAALPDYMKWGAVREMHQPKAAGTAIEANVEDDGRTFFGAHVVDSEAVKKVKAGVYKGFSIGGKVTARDELNKSIVKGLKLVEISLVDRPANPEAVFTCYKSETVTDDEESVTAPADNATNTEKAETAEIKKSMWTVRQFAELLQGLAYLAQDSQYESEWEGDNSPIPAELRQWISDGATLFGKFAAEEVAEMLASLQPVVKSAMADDLRKAGARFSKNTKAALKAAHDACKAADKALADLKYEDAEEDADDETGKAESADDLVKSELTGKISKLESENDQLQKRIKELESQPAPPKGAVKVIGKADDVVDIEKQEVEPVRKSDGSIDEAATAIKKAHQSGGKRLR